MKYLRLSEPLLGLSGVIAEVTAAKITKKRRKILSFILFLLNVC